ncbi:hypothetical protein P170DRAFT_355966 [Aspergillus steynii IBT 23096]|uniref:Rhodopsin domain-containing protein n=1 Tax=Aspergillus steynii IBT 23096 TaxID=1392250 RepID=A0A2I2GE38_9EURO|nr:uncharacterized protein P170DRAFT_355966 [Aspergillus steynii IBT 23096]PLB51166.1 hypothetical protein P170DRAFT_355966 [Aspergillus steynii IBT 23096]
MAGSTANDEKQGPGKGSEMMAVMWALTGVTTFIVVARLFIRQKVLRVLGLDDWLIAISMVLGLIFVGTATASAAYGYGEHTAKLDIADAEKGLFYNSVSFIFGILSFALPKLAVAALLNRLLNPSLIHRIITWGLASFVGAVAIVNIIIYVTMCDPPQALWKISMVMNGEATCRDIWILIHYATFNGAISAFVDLYLAIYPSTVLFKLQMSLRKKIALSAAMGLGAVAAACAIVKCAQIKGLADKTDPTYGTVPLVIWTNVEANVVVIASCIPTLQPLLELILGKRKLTSGGKSNSRHKYYQQSSQQGHDPSQSHRSRRSHALHKQDYTLTTDVESRESILRENRLDNAVDTAGPLHIHRTDDVHIEYEMQTQAPPEPTQKRSFS